MITQKELIRLKQLQIAERELKQMKEDLKARITEGEKVESGPFILDLSRTDTVSRKYKDVVERMKEIHPEMAGAIVKMVEANTEIDPLGTWTFRIEPGVPKV